ncbi:hypothetical protein G2W53_022122 [Senna tora]|uniref:Uncharacterized protein n=1 Tax=Senna tora TaxID=362788 RepID=A0A834TKP1_9FABA|nr:hypothetical protein G2W53_022122 [Senna tora]
MVVDDEGSAFNDADDEEDTGNPYVDMVVDAARGRLDPNFECMEKANNPSASRFYELLEDADEPLWDGYYNLTKLSVVSQRLNLKSEFNMSQISGSRVNGEWWAACKVRAKLFMDETLNSVGEVSNEFSTSDYYQDDESLTIHDRTSEEEEINLLDAHGLMEEVNLDELPHPMNAPHIDQFIDDNEETDHNEFLDSDEELFDSDSSSDS